MLRLSAFDRRPLKLAKRRPVKLIPRFKVCWSSRRHWTRTLFLKGEFCQLLLNHGGLVGLISTYSDHFLLEGESTAGTEFLQKGLGTYPSARDRRRQRPVRTIAAALSNCPTYRSAADYESAPFQAELPIGCCLGPKIPSRPAKAQF